MIVDFDVSQVVVDTDVVLVAIGAAVALFEPVTSIVVVVCLLVVPGVGVGVVDDSSIVEHLHLVSPHHLID